MSTELRTLLDEHSNDIQDLPAVERLAAVRGRVRVVRRRRQAGLAGAAAAVVAVVGAAVFLPSDGLDPAAQRELAGHTAPETFDSLGYTYAFVKGVEGDGKAVLDLPESDQPMLVSWASSSGSGGLRVPGDLDGDGGSPDTIAMGDADFGGFEYLDPQVSGKIVATGDGEVAVAVYTRTDATPPGVSKDGVTFRDDRGGDSLLQAVIGDEGQSELTAQIAMPDRFLVMRKFCYGVPQGYQTNISVNGQVSSFGDCDDSKPLDGSGSAMTFSGGVPDGHGSQVEPGDPVQIRMWLTRDNGDEEDPSPVAVEAPGVHLGLGLYEEAPAVATVGTWHLPAVWEQDGHRWQFAGVTSSTPGESSISTQVTAGDVPVLVVAMTAGQGSGAAEFFLDGEPGSVNGGGPGGWQGVEAIVRNARTVAELRVHGEVGPHTVLGLATYQRID